MNSDGEDTQTGAMNAVNAVLLFILVWTFTAVCQADKDISVNCDGATGSVGKEVTLTCSVSLQKDICCIKNSLFRYDGLIICKAVPEDSCEHSKIFTCHHTPNTATTEKYSFFVQASCGWNTTKFTVSTTGYSGHINTAAGLGSKVVVSSLIIILIIIIIIIIMIGIYKTKQNFLDSITGCFWLSHMKSQQLSRRCNI